MTEEDAQLYLTLKFSTINEIIMAFDKAIGIPKGHLPSKSGHQDIVRAGIHKWVEQGCPETMDIPDDEVEFFIKLKFGNVEKAYYHWINTPPGNDHGLTEKELAIVMDYVPKPDKTVDKQ